MLGPDRAPRGLTGAFLEASRKVYWTALCCGLRRADLDGDNEEASRAARGVFRRIGSRRSSGARGGGGSARGGSLRPKTPKQILRNLEQKKTRVGREELAEKGEGGPGGCLWSEEP